MQSDMSENAQRIGHRDLGFNSDGIGAEAVLYGDGNVVIQDTEGETPDRILLERKQVVALVAWLVNQDELAGPD